jgi:LmbE family N-acetylglucosaminyl deacetylase
MCAGTLALLAAQGYDIHIATVTGGEVGSPDLTRQEIRRRRLGEAESSAAVLGGTYHYAGGCDLEVEYSASYRRKTTRVVREVDPFMVLTLPPMDYLPDHEQASTLVRNAAYVASVPLYDCGEPTEPTEGFPYLYYWNASNLTDIFGRALPVHFGVDVSSVMETKREMLACHESQREWLRYHNGWDAYMDQMENWTEKQGDMIGRTCGECFIQHRSTGHPKDNVMAEILGPDLCINLEGDDKECSHTTGG